MGGSFRQAGLQCIAVRVCGAMCQTLAIYMDRFVACMCVCATSVCATYASWQRMRATPSKFRWLGAYGASKGVLNNARARRSQRSNPRSEFEDAIRRVLESSAYKHIHSDLQGTTQSMHHTQVTTCRISLTPRIVCVCVIKVR